MKFAVQIAIMMVVSILNRTFTRLLSLTNKIHPWFRAKQWHILPEPPKAAKAEYSYCFARKHGWILFVRDKSRVNVILAILNIRNYSVIENKVVKEILSHLSPNFRILKFFNTYITKTSKLFVSIPIAILIRMSYRVVAFSLTL